MRMDTGRGGVGWSAATVLEARCAPVEHEEAVLEEAAVSLVINGAPYAVMMATPDHLEDFFRGFLWSEGVLRSLAEIVAWEAVQVAEGWAIYLQLADAAAARVAQKRRHIIGGSACGLCGTPCFRGLVPFAPIRRALWLDADVIHDLLAQMQARQALNRHTGTAHAAILARPQSDLVREDIGRHNAVDKAVGAALEQGWARDEAVMLGVSSRLTFEMVLKALGFGVPIVAAISGVSSLAIQVADSHGLTLIGYTRDARMTVYAHGERIRGCTPARPRVAVPCLK